METLNLMSARKAVKCFIYDIIKLPLPHSGKNFLANYKSFV